MGIGTARSHMQPTGRAWPVAILLTHPVAAVAQACEQMKVWMRAAQSPQSLPRAQVLAWASAPPFWHVTLLGLAHRVGVVETFGAEENRRAG